VNLGLRVAAKRGDGYHEIDTVFLALDLQIPRLVATGFGIA
jgi:4-diphosphocytidyl-2C-methyl-D-erythritol kinase